MAVDYRHFDPLAVEYLLRVATLNQAVVPPTPTPVTVSVEERSLRSYDQFVPVSGGAS